MCTLTCTNLVLFVTAAWFVDGMVAVVTGILAYTVSGRKYGPTAIVTFLLAALLLGLMMYLRGIGATI